MKGLRILPGLMAALCLAACGSSSAPAPQMANPPPAGPARCGEHPWCDRSLSPAQRTELLLARMTLSQKLGLMAGDDLLGAATGEPAVGTSDGIPELGIPTLYMSDGPVGVRERQTTAMPSPIALAATFDPTLARRTGQAIANEVRLKGNDLVHAPTVDIMRTALAGRTFETYGEDPYVSSRMAVEWIRGAQGEGVIANVKHYAPNSQEGQIGLPPLSSVIGGRHLVNAVIDERTLREIYLLPFEAAVKEAGVGSIMCAYNFINGSPACASHHLMQEVLRDDWGFDGFVVSDYVLAVKDSILSARNGTEIEMPIPVFYAPLLMTPLVLAGAIPESVIDTRVGNILRTLFRFGFFDRADYPSDDSLIDQQEHAAVALDSAVEGIVLLRNQGLLPLQAGQLHKLAIIGNSGDVYRNGGGSSAVSPFRFVSPRDAIAARAGAGVEILDNAGDDAAQAAALAAVADAAVVFVTDNSSEGTDKTCLSLDCPPFWSPIPLPAAHPQDELVSAVAAANPNTIVVLLTAGPVLTPWRNEIAALLAAWYPGQEGGAALAAILFGDRDPGGRLPVTFPAAEAQTPTAGNLAQYPGLGEIAIYSEGVLLGYRWYDAHGEEPAYAFGHGLSYTQFRYSDLSVGAGEVSVTVTNIGTRRGSEVAQLYLGLPPPSPGIVQPPRQLKGFRKAQLGPGESARLRFALDERAYSYWDEAAAGWRVAPGCYTVEVGTSSRVLPLQGQVAQGGGSCP